jgi:hypothetical protein
MPYYRDDRPARSFDRDAKEQADDEAWAFNIGCWYIRRYWVGSPACTPRAFDAARSFDPAGRESQANIRDECEAVHRTGGPPWVEITA